MSDKQKQNIPSLQIINTGEKYKIYQVIGDTGMYMPPHLSTKEAVVIVYKGTSILEISNTKKHLNEGDVVIVPQDEVHSMTINSKFKSFVIMENDSEIKFANK